MKLLAKHVDCLNPHCPDCIEAALSCQPHEYRAWNELRAEEKKKDAP